MIFKRLQLSNEPLWIPESLKSAVVVIEPDKFENEIHSSGERIWQSAIWESRSLPSVRRKLTTLPTDLPKSGHTLTHTTLYRNHTFSPIGIRIHCFIAFICDLYVDSRRETMSRCQCIRETWDGKPVQYNSSYFWWDIGEAIDDKLKFRTPRFSLARIFIWYNAEGDWKVQSCSCIPQRQP